MKTLQFLSIGLFTFALVWIAGHEPGVRRVATNLLISGGRQLAAVGLVSSVDQVTAPATSTLASDNEGAASGPTSVAAASVTFPPLTAKFALGDQGAHVVQLQEMLGALGIYTGSTTGKYDVGTIAAVTQFQTTYGLPVTPETAGLAGPATRAELNKRLASSAAIENGAKTTASTPKNPAVVLTTVPAPAEAVTALQPLLEPLLLLLGSGF